MFRVFFRKSEHCERRQQCEQTSKRECENKSTWEVTLHTIVVCKLDFVVE